MLRLLTRKKAPFGDSTPKTMISAMTMTAMPTGVDRAARANRPNGAGAASGNRAGRLDHAACTVALPPSISVTTSVSVRSRAGVFETVLPWRMTAMRSARLSIFGISWEMTTTASPRLAAERIDLVDDVGLLGAERGGGLVHQDRGRRPHDRARDGDGLALAAGEVPHGAVDAVQRGDACSAYRLLRSLPHSSPVEGSRPAAEQAADDRFPAEEHVLGDGKIRSKREVLVDRLDAKFLGVADRCDRRRFSPEGEAAAVGRRGRRI